MSAAVDTLAPPPAAQNAIDAIDSLLTMPLVRLSTHAKKLGALRAWIITTELRIRELESTCRKLETNR